ncbi:flavin monoamine oxidase family protein [Paenibacillus flagellatus]|uniref:flavin monoamine oxidase family protein n=1 Tax=Paenibacillus flagellatus TaxID=2211139 RepID=UPI0013051619|nr:NAD(P)/FAD-dependent oxidoreductase [Paenibacillus flagellatus]
MREARRTEVIVVGAGLAGLSAALALYDRGIDVIVLEAQSRVGGKVLSVVEDGVTVDYGAQWISPHQPRMKALLARFGLTTVPTFAKGDALYVLRGDRMRGNGDRPPLGWTGKLDLFRIRRKLDKLAGTIDPGAPWKSAAAPELDALTMETWLEKAAFSTAAKSFCRAVAEEGLCARLSEVSMLDVLWDYVSAGGVDKLMTAEDEWIAGGTQQLPAKMAERLGDAVRPDNAVRTIRWGGGQVTAYTDREAWTGRRAIVAIPPTFTNRIAYEPPLPPDRDQLCQRIGQGAVIKFVLVYDTPFWRERGWSGSAYGETGPIQTVLDGTEPGQRLGVLAAMANGGHARRLGRLGKEERKTEVLRSLARFVGEKALEPVAVYEKDWSADPWIRGGYGGRFAPGVLSEFGPSLLEPVGPIHWAGAETATVWRMYMEGALQSGERAAEEVARALEAERPAGGSAARITR